MDTTSGVEPTDMELRDAIIDEAIAIAERDGWENVRLRNVAGALGVPLTEVLRHFRDLDGVADAWFARAWVEMLAPVDDAFWALPVADRLEFLLLRWFDALATHRAVSVQMLKLKMWPFHPHHWVPMIFNLSRTIQWLRDAGGLDAEAPRREVEEIGLTWLFVFTLAVWSRDETEGQERTRRFLRNRLAQADALMARLFPPRSGAAEDTVGENGDDER